VVYLGVSKKSAREAIKLVIAELNKFRDQGITEGSSEPLRSTLRAIPSGRRKPRQPDDPPGQVRDLF